MGVLDMSAKGTVSRAVMKKLISTFPETIRVIDQFDVGIVVRAAHSTINYDKIVAVLMEQPQRKAVIPIHCNNKHWCSIMIDMPGKAVFCYDPLSTSYEVAIKAFVRGIVIGISRASGGRERFAMQEHAAIGELRGRECAGIYTLLAIEMFAGARGLCQVDKHLLKYHQYRYLLRCI